MEKFKFPAQLIITLITLNSFSTIALATQKDMGFATAMDKKLLGLGEEKLTRLRLFWQYILGGPKPTSLQIVPPPVNSSKFGLVQMVDNALTQGQALNSTLLGRAQGLYRIASQRDISFLISMNFAFTVGKYNGSSITILGRNSLASPVRELPVVGGSGLFRSARGYAQLTTHMYDPKTGTQRWSMTFSRSTIEDADEISLQYFT